MHDICLIKGIYNELKKICAKYDIVKLERVFMEVNINIHIDEENFKEFVKEQKDPVIGEWTKIEITKTDIEENTAIIHVLEGERNEDFLDE